MEQIAKIETIKNSRGDTYNIKTRECSWGFHGCSFYIYQGARVNKLYDLFTALGAKCNIIDGKLKYTARGKGKLQRLLFKFNRYAGNKSTCRIIDTAHEMLKTGINPIACLILGHYIGEPSSINNYKLPNYYYPNMDVLGYYYNNITYLPKDNDDFLKRLKTGSDISNTFFKIYNKNLYPKIVDLIQNKKYKQAEKLIKYPY